MAEPKTLSAAGQPRPLNVLGDAPDIRDRYYQPAQPFTQEDMKGY